MARADLASNRKFMRLAAALNHLACGMGDLLARGALETMWSRGYERADDFLGDEQDVEVAANWRGEQGFLFRALRDAGKPGAGFVEHDQERGGFVIYAFWEHSPPWVKRKFSGRIAREAEGKTISDRRRDAANSKRSANGHSLAGSQQAIGQQSVSKSVPLDGTGRDGKGKIPPKPPQGGVAVAPSEESQRDPEESPAGDSGESPCDLFGHPVEESPPRLDFERLYRAYPRHEGHAEGIARCERSIKTLDEYRDLEAAIAKYARHCDETGVEIKHFSTFVGTPRGAKEPRWREWAPSPEEREQAAALAAAVAKLNAAAEARMESGEAFRD